jgi:RNase P subunit RPR2
VNRRGVGFETAQRQTPRGSDGLPRNPVATTEEETSKEAVMAETWSGEFYCVKCKDKRTAEGEIRVNDKGTKMAKGVCPVCGTNLNRILGKA